MAASMGTCGVDCNFYWVMRWFILSMREFAAGFGLLEETLG